MYYIYLPKKMYPSKDIFEDIGFKFEKVDSDLFYKAILPDGWALIPDISAVTNIVDTSNNIRGSITFYTNFNIFEKLASMELYTRYKVITAYDENLKPFIKVIDSKSDDILFKSEQFDDKNSTQFLQFNKFCIDYLNTNFPNWEDVSKYWD